MKRTAATLGILLATLSVAAPAAADGRPAVVASATDSTRGTTATDRASHTATLRGALVRLTDTLQTNGRVDASLTTLTVETRANTICVSAQVRLAISDANGKIVSVLVGGARVEAPVRPNRARQLPSLRLDAVEAAVDGMAPKIELALQGSPRRANTMVATKR